MKNIENSVAGNPVFKYLSEIGFLHSIAEDYRKGAVYLNKNNTEQKERNHPFNIDDEIGNYSFCLLSVTSLELFLKVIIASNIYYQYKIEGRKNPVNFIEKEFRRLSQKSKIPLKGFYVH